MDQWITLVGFLGGILGAFWFEWVGGLVEARGIAEMFPRRSTAHRGWWPNSRPARAIHTQDDDFASSSTTTL